MKFLNPRTDFAFKRIFGSDSSGDILLSFLNAILGLESPYRLESISILDPYLAPKIKGMKDTYLDVRAKDEQGKSYIIEMQVLNVAGFEKRILYNACKTYAGQIERGEEYHLLTEVIAITITDFLMFPESAEIINKYKLRGADGEVYTDDLELVFAELPKFNKNEAELTNTLDRWYYFLKYANDLEVIPEAFKQESSILHAFELASKSALTPQELDDQERREIYIQDQRGAIQFAENKGLIKGIQQGIQQGLQEGLQQGIQQGKSTFLQRELIRRFGQISDEIRSQLASARPEQLEQWADNIFAAQVIEEVFIERI